MAYRRRRKKREAAEPTVTPSLVNIPAGQVPTTWPLVAEHIERGLIDGDRTVEELYNSCLTNMAQLWVVWSDKLHAAGVTSVVNTRHGKFLQFESFAGEDMAAWFNTQDDLYAIAKGHGFIGVRLCGRRGWERALEAKGFRLKHTILEKDLR
jgi:hypothetical protein